MVGDRLREVAGVVAAAAARAGRSSDAVTVVAVTKGRSVDQILEAYEAGQRDFGENRAQELAAKHPLLPDDIRWHFVGTLQSNKVRAVAPRVVLLHSLDRTSLLRAWSRVPEPPPVLVQVNVSGESSKHGVAPGAAADLVDRAVAAGIRVGGLMTIARLDPDPENARAGFRDLAALRARLARVHPEVTELSMGMTDDYPVAIEEGATLVRVGRAIFGPRTA